ncbi:MAG: FAD-dependent monooxygenase, partial [Pseudolabrys sp.]
LTLAYWLKHWGFSPTIVEKRPDLNDRGYGIDFYGSGFDVAEKMGLVPTLRARAAQYPIKQVVWIDNRGRVRATLDIEKFRAVLHQRYFTLMRGDIETALYQSVRDSVPVRFGASISQLDSQADRVNVTLSDGTRAAYDLVIGADGIHSQVRSLLWGDEKQFSRFLGFYVACSVIDNFFDQPQTVFGHFEPNVQALVYPIDGNKLATFFGFRSEPLDVHSRAACLEVLERVLGRCAWVIPQLLESTKTANEFLFDAVAQIELERWHMGRVALAGDACQCLTLLAGQGASMGMAGAYMLADELNNAAGDYQVAFAAYQQALKPEIERRQRDARGLSGTFIPRNNFEIALSHFLFNASTCLASAPCSPSKLAPRVSLSNWASQSQIA